MDPEISILITGGLIGASYFLVCYLKEGADLVERYKETFGRYPNDHMTFNDINKRLKHYDKHGG